MPTISEQIADHTAAREKSFVLMDEITTLAGDEGRTFTDEEETRFDTAAQEVKKRDAQIARLEAMEVVQKARAKPVTDGGAYDLGTTAPRIQVVRNLPKGVPFTRYALALMCCKGSLSDAEMFANRKTDWRDTPEVVRAIQTARALGGPHVMRAAVPTGTTTDATFAAPLVEYRTMASEFIELLRPASIIGAIQARGSAFRNVPFGVRIQRQTQAVSVGWVGEGKSKPVSRPGFDALTVPFTKMAVIVAITEELARFSDPSAETLIRDDMVASISDFMNSQFIDPTVAGTPGLAPASITNAGTAHPSTGSTVDAIITDIATMTSAIAAANLPLNGLVWVMNPRSAIHIASLRTAQDVFAFPEMGTGNLRGIPVVQSNAVPIVGGLTTITLLAPNQILLADDGSVTLDTSTEASIQMDSAPTTPPSPMVSFWQQNLLGIRAERFVYWQLLNASAVQVLTGVAY